MDPIINHTFSSFCPAEATSSDQAVVPPTVTKRPKVNWPKVVKTEEIYTLYVGDDIPSLEFYISGKAEVSRKTLYLRGFYYGSGTRINPIGTVYEEKTKRTFGKHIVLLRGDDLLYDFIVDAETFAPPYTERGADMEVELANGVTIILRDLHRFEDYPYEISGIRFPISEVALSQ